MYPTLRAHLHWNYSHIECSGTTRNGSYPSVQHSSGRGTFVPKSLVLKSRLSFSNSRGNKIRTQNLVWQAAWRLIFVIYFFPSLAICVEVLLHSTKVRNQSNNGLQSCGIKPLERNRKHVRPSWLKTSWLVCLIVSWRPVLEFWSGLCFSPTEQTPQGLEKLRRQGSRGRKWGKGLKSESWKKGIDLSWWAKLYKSNPDADGVEWIRELVSRNWEGICFELSRRIIFFRSMQIKLH